MIGNGEKDERNRKERRAVVVGAGFSGLSTAYYLVRSGFSVEVYERSKREGGLIGTTETEFGIAESAANAFSNSPRVEALFSDLGLPLVPAKKESRARYFFRGDRARRWPIGFSATLFVLGFLFRFLFSRSTVEPRPKETLSDWGRRVLGEEATEFLVLPAFQGIYSGDGRRLSATLLLGSFFRRAPRTGRSRSIRGSVSAPGGMVEVVRRMRERLESRGVRFRFEEEAPEPDPGVRTFYCGSAAQVSESLSRSAPELSRLLSRIEVLPLVSVTAFFPETRRSKRGFGVLFPPSERFRSLGVLYNDSIFPNRVFREGIRSETWILGGALRPEIPGLSLERLLTEFLGDRKRLHGYPGTAEAPIRYVLHRWSRAIPHYTVELESILPEIRRSLSESKNLRLVGNYLGGIGLSKILDLAAEEAKRAEEAEKK